MFVSKLVSITKGARHKIENFRWEYSHYRPHSPLDDLTSKGFVNLQLTIPETSTFDRLNKRGGGGQL